MIRRGFNNNNTPQRRSPQFQPNGHSRTASRGPPNHGQQLPPQLRSPQFQPNGHSRTASRGPPNHGQQLPPAPTHSPTTTAAPTTTTAAPTTTTAATTSTPPCSGIISCINMPTNGHVCWPSGNTIITDSAFYNCATLTSINIPKEVTRIGHNAFRNCPRLKSVTFNDIENSLLESIGKDAFRNCTNLTSIIIPKEVTSIGYYLNIFGIGKNYLPFRDCKKLESITVLDGNSKFVSNNGVLFLHWSYSDNTKLKRYPPGKDDSSYMIPSSVSHINSMAFRDCKNLTSVTIPDSVTWIGGSAFAFCSSLTSITIPNSVTSIEEYAFSSTPIKNCVAAWQNDTTTTQDLAITSVIDGVCQYDPNYWNPDTFTNYEGFSNQSSQINYAKRAGSANLILKSLLFACLYYVLAHPDVYTKIIRKISKRINKTHGLIICCVLFTLIFYTSSIFL